VSDNVAGTDLHDHVSPIIFNTRKTVKLFKYSPARISLLQHRIIKSRKMEPQVILGCKTRWNTLERINERFSKILNPIETVSRQLKCGHFWKEKRYEIVRDMLNCLKPVRLAV
jgi:hypothetical protein